MPPLYPIQSPRPRLVHVSGHVSANDAALQSVLQGPVAPRTARVERNTKETQISVELGVDGTGQRTLDTPLPFLTHMLDALARHGLFDLAIKARGDIEIDGHHTVEDVGLVLGQAFREALGDRAGIARYGWATLPMDETMVTVAVDFSGRPAFVWNVPGLEGKWIGGFDCELAKEFFAAFATRAEANVHVLLHYGGNPHHVIECTFKALAKALDAATKIDPRTQGAVPSTKGTLTS
jgi:imidazoleglycerol-phosphate dehydratase